MILVTGASGLLGYHLCKRLLQDGHGVIGLVHKTPLKSHTTRFKACKGDVTKLESLLNIFTHNKIDTVIHLAAALPYDMNPKYFQVNVVGSGNILELSRQYDVKRFIFASSMSVYSRPEYLPVDESHPASPQSMYGKNKYCIENVLPEYGIPYTILRYSGMYGIGQKQGRAIGTFVKQVLNNEPITVNGDGSQSSDFIYVKDAVEGTILALDKPGIYNIGSGQEMSLLELAKLVVKLTDSKSEIILDKKPVDRPFRFVSDISKARKELGFNPMSVEEGIKAYIDEVSK